MDRAVHVTRSRARDARAARSGCRRAPSHYIHSSTPFTHLIAFRFITSALHCVPPLGFSEHCSSGQRAVCPRCITSAARCVPRWVSASTARLANVRYAIGAHSIRARIIDIRIITSALRCVPRCVSVSMARLANVRYAIGVRSHFWLRAARAARVRRRTPRAARPGMAKRNAVDPDTNVSKILKLGKANWASQRAITSLACCLFGTRRPMPHASLARALCAIAV